MHSGNYVREAAFALTMFLSSSTGAGDLPRVPPEQVGFSPARFEYIDNFYAEKVRGGELAGIVILVSRHSKIAHFTAIGYADVETRQSMEVDTMFRIYSMTKPITSTALMLLYEEGRFQMGDTLPKFIPEFANLRVSRTRFGVFRETVPLERAPTMQDLLRHTAGFMHGLTDDIVDREYIRSDIFSPEISLAEMMARLSKIPLAYQPGTRFAYSIVPDIQARLVEVMSSMPFDEFLETRLFKPLGMTDAGFRVPPDKAKRLAVVHWLKDGKIVPLDEIHGRPIEGRWVAEPRSVNSYLADHKHKGGSYGLVSSAEDYWRFAQMLLNSGELNGVRILSPQVTHYMTVDHLGSISIESSDHRPTGVTFGLGFGIVKNPAEAGFISSEGTLYWSGAAGTAFWIDPKEDIVIIAMSQHMSVPAADVLRTELPTLVYSALMH